MHLYFVLLVIVAIFSASGSALPMIADCDQTTMSKVKSSDLVRSLDSGQNDGDAGRRSLRAASCRRTEERSILSGLRKFIVGDPIKKTAKKMAKFAAEQKQYEIKLATKPDVLNGMLANDNKKYAAFKHWHENAKFKLEDSYKFLKVRTNKQYEQLYHDYRIFLQDKGIGVHVRVADI